MLKEKANSTKSIEREKVMDKEYVQYGYEWRKEMMKLTKSELILLFKSVCVKNDDITAENKRLRKFISKIIDGHYFDPVIGFSLSMIGDAQKALKERE